MRDPTKEYTLQARIFLYLLKLNLHLNLAKKFGVPELIICFLGITQQEDEQQPQKKKKEVYRCTHIYSPFR